jgi:rod shape-determining protein MreC
MRFIYTRLFAVFFAFVFIVFVLVFLNSIGKLESIQKVFLYAPRPFISVAKAVGYPVKIFFYSLYHLRQIAKENTDLVLEISQLRQELVLFEQEKKENEALRKELQFVKSTNLKLIPCVALSETVIGLSDSVYINCGEETGVSEGMGVISQGYLIGKISRAGKNLSTVLLATGSNFLTDGKILTSNSQGLVKGSFGSGLVIDQLPQNDKIEKGSLVVTAGISEKIPKNILVGEVGDLVSSSNELFKKAIIVSPIDFRNLNFVFVVRP